MSLSVLIVDDDPSLRMISAVVLGSLGKMQVSQAGSGAEAIERALAERPNVVLLDLVLPDMDGRDVITEMRSLPELANTHIIVCSARAEREIEAEVCSRGAIGMITKPFEPPELLERVKSLVAAAER